MLPVGKGQWCAGQRNIKKVVITILHQIRYGGLMSGGLPGVFWFGSADVHTRVDLPRISRDNSATPLGSQVKPKGSFAARSGPNDDSQVWEGGRSMHLCSLYYSYV